MTNYLTTIPTSKILYDTNTLSYILHLGKIFLKHFNAVQLQMQAQI